VRNRTRAYPLRTRIRVLRALLTRDGRLSLTERTERYARRIGCAPITIWRWLRRYRADGVQGIQKRLRSDLFTRRRRLRS
jgi:hypothetical protein